MVWAIERLEIFVELTPQNRLGHIKACGQPAERLTGLERVEQWHVLSQGTEHITRRVHAERRGMSYRKRFPAPEVDAHVRNIEPSSPVQIYIQRTRVRV